MNRYDGIQLIGAPAWKLLVSRYGGCEYEVPSQVGTRRGADLAALVGDAAAAALIDYAAGDRVYIAAGWEEILSARYAEIVALHESGMTPSQIARAWEGKIKYSERNVRMILAGRFETLRASIGDADQMALEL